MRALWHAAVSVQLDDVMRLKTEAQQAVVAADAARTDAELRVELLRQEVTELRTALTGRDAELAGLRAQHTLVRDRYAPLDATLQNRQSQLDAAAAERATLERATLERAHAEGLAQAQQRYEALSKQLLQETAHQREALKKEHTQFASQLKFAERRIAALEVDRGQLEAELASERATRQQAMIGLWVTPSTKNSRSRLDTGVAW